MGSLIIHPQPQDAFADLDTGVSRSNNWMNTSFLFRDRGMSLLQFLLAITKACRATLEIHRRRREARPRKIIPRREPKRLR